MAGCGLDIHSFCPEAGYRRQQRKSNARPKAGHDGERQRYQRAIALIGQQIDSRDGTLPLGWSIAPC